MIQYNVTIANNYNYNSDNNNSNDWCEYKALGGK